MSTLEDKITALETRIAALETPGIDQGQFRLLFTFEERQAEEVFRQKAQDTVKGETPEPVDPLAPTPTETEELNAWLSARLYLTMRADFDQAAYIDLEDPAVSAALDFYIAWGLLAPERKAEVLAGTRLA
ncbi:hypothetical protein [Oceanicaulis sp.]|uniref:hypothetical protein n=1 Tax=Oceanicaulis sp. TaxID=1924941 RepID=UPI003F72ACF6